MSQPQLLFATTNRGKLLEAQRVAEGLGVTFFDLDKLAGDLQLALPHVVEGEGSYYGNAALKARTYSKWSGVPVIADDTGLEVQSLRGLPGVFTARFGVDRVRQQLGQLRCAKATFVCCVAYAEPMGRIVAVTERLEGQLVFDSSTDRVSGPLPYSQVFVPQGESKTLSELVSVTSSVTSYLSHRGRALAALLKAISLAAGQE